jgi:putative transposase
MTTVWKRESIYTTESGLKLSNGPKQDPLLVKIPALYREANISRVELLYKAGKYSLALTIDTGVELPEPMEASQGIICGGDLGEVHMVSLTTETGETLILSGRALRSFKQWRNKARARCAKALKRCEPESRRYQRLINKRNQISAKAKRQQRDYLHKAAKITVDFLVAQGVSVLYLGDVRNAADRVNLGKKANQKISQWVHGEFRALVTEKARRVGITVLLIDESYSTKTCCYCNHRRKSSPSGRVYRCTKPGCKVKLHRDANGSCNIVSKARYGKYGKIQPTRIKYLQPLDLKHEIQRQGSSGAEPAQVASVS